MLYHVIPLTISPKTKRRRLISTINTYKHRTFTSWTNFNKADRKYKIFWRSDIGKEKKIVHRIKSKQLLNIRQVKVSPIKNQK